MALVKGKKCNKEQSTIDTNNVSKEKRKIFVIASILIITLIIALLITVTLLVTINKENGKADSSEKSNVENNSNSNFTDLEKDEDVPEKPVKPKNDNEEKAKNLTEFTDYVDKNEIAQDENGNKIVIPKGFKVLLEEGKIVQEGIVIRDDNENEFVWIPVGNIKDSVGKITLIELARHKFDYDGNISLTATDGSEISSDSYGSQFEYAEVSSKSSYGNSKAKNITQFMDSVIKNGGYYIARYEAGNNKGKVTSKSGVAVWNNITQSEATRVSQKMYDSDSFESDLINSYAWDTAILFIQTYSDNSYSRQTTLNESLSYTGKRENGTIDKMSNIYDMASNVAEWTTETQLHSGYNCVHRGGNYLHQYQYTSSRSSNTADEKYNHISFRPILYIK